MPNAVVPACRRRPWALINSGPRRRRRPRHYAHRATQQKALAQRPREITVVVADHHAPLLRLRIAHGADHGDEFSCSSANRPLVAWTLICTPTCQLQQPRTFGRSPWYGVLVMTSSAELDRVRWAHQLRSYRASVLRIGVVGPMVAAMVVGTSRSEWQQIVLVAPTRGRCIVGSAVSVASRRFFALRRFRSMRLEPFAFLPSTF